MVAAFRCREPRLRREFPAGVGTEAGPQGTSDKTVPGRCKGKAHRRDTLGLPGRRVLVSRRWSGKTLPDHKQDRVDFVRQLLADAGSRSRTPRTCASLRSNLATSPDPCVST
ncbi:replication initiator [Nocardia sp. NPDC049149]|uniref:replication initiator n=1 Tax=Nocardia sp. NPDC049149 TaxID=3364315 RepID=UPI0037162E90